MNEFSQIMEVQSGINSNNVVPSSLEQWLGHKVKQCNTCGGVAQLTLDIAGLPQLFTCERCCCFID